MWRGASGYPNDMSDPGGLLEQVAGAPAEIALVRRAATDHLGRCGCANADDAVLVLSELVTNAVLHAGGADRITVDCRDGSIRIDVHDGATDAARVPDVAPEVGGRGLRIVEALAERWGSDPLDAGKVVWAELPCRR